MPRRLERDWSQTGPVGYPILVAVTRPEQVDWVLPPALALARVVNGRVLLRYLMEVPPGRSLSEAAGEAIQLRETLEARARPLLREGADVQIAVRVVRETWEGLWETVQAEGARVLFWVWESELLPRTARSRLYDPRLTRPPCDLVLFKPGPQWRKQAIWPQVKHILLPLQETPHASLALRVADALAEWLQAHITVLFAVPSHQEDGHQVEARVRAAFGPVLRELRSVVRTVVVEGGISESVLNEVQGYPILVMGTADSDETWLDLPLQQIAEKVQTGLILTRKARPLGEARPRATLALRARHHPIAILVDKWFAENTFHSREFEDLEQLVRLKEAQGVTISLGLPALNEEETIGNVIDTMKRALMDEVPLLDEIVLIDSGSVDYTREIAMSKGIPVYIHQEILPQYGAYHGKGEALWKSLYVLKGDIIVWIDTDIRNPDPRFVYGVLGPLLKYPHIQYVKGFYRRPLKQGDRLVAGGGGRVTELTARPLINLFFPELSGFIQPLSGEYAGRRRALEQVPFFTGYGVETGLLIDILEKFGLYAMAQVDLLERIHRNQPLQALSKMAFAIIQVVVKRLEERHKIHLLEDIHKTMHLIRYEPGRYYLEPVEIEEYERPPMATIPEYQARHGARGGG